MRHTHATHALERGVNLTVMRDNLRHASVSTTSVTCTPTSRSGLGSWERPWPERPA